MSVNLRNLETILSAYLDCALWSSTDESTESGGEPLDRNYSISDFTARARREAMRDIRTFLRLTAEIDSSAWSDEQLGHDFWLTRNGHGAGFWERDFAPDAIGRALTQHTKSFGECYLYVTPRGKIAVE